MKMGADTMSAVDSSDLVILVPMLGRAHHVAPLLESIRDATPDVRVLFCCTEGDDEVIDAVSRESFGFLVFPPREHGDFAHKINAGYRLTTEPYVFTGASDIRFRPGWFQAAVKHFDDPRIGVVGTNDIYSRRAGSHATHFLVRRSYVDEHGTCLDGPGVLWPECYWHEYGDDELEGVTTKAGAYVLEPAAEVPHEHPLWPGSPTHGQWDETYRAMGERQRVDAGLYTRRRRQWTT